MLGRTEHPLGAGGWNPQLMPMKFWILNINTLPLTCILQREGYIETALGTEPVYCCTKESRQVGSDIFVCANILALFVKSSWWRAHDDHGFTCCGHTWTVAWFRYRYVLGRTGRHAKRRFSPEQSAGNGFAQLVLLILLWLLCWRTPKRWSSASAVH